MSIKNVSNDVLLKITQLLERQDVVSLAFTCTKLATFCDENLAVEGRFRDDNTYDVFIINNKFMYRPQFKKHTVVDKKQYNLHQLDEMLKDKNIRMFRFIDTYLDAAYCAKLIYHLSQMKYKTTSPPHPIRADLDLGEEEFFEDFEAPPALRRRESLKIKDKLSDLVIFERCDIDLGSSGMEDVKYEFRIEASEYITCQSNLIAMIIREIGCSKAHFEQSDPLGMIMPNIIMIIKRDLSDTCKTFIFRNMPVRLVIRHGTTIIHSDEKGYSIDHKTDYNEKQKRKIGIDGDVYEKWLNNKDSSTSFQNIPLYPTYNMYCKIPVESVDKNKFPMIMSCFFKGYDKFYYQFADDIYALVIEVFLRRVDSSPSPLKLTHEPKNYFQIGELNIRKVRDPENNHADSADKVLAQLKSYRFGHQAQLDLLYS